MSFNQLFQKGRVGPSKGSVEGGEDNFLASNSTLGGSEMDMAIIDMLNIRQDTGGFGICKGKF